MARWVAALALGIALAAACGEGSSTGTGAGAGGSTATTSSGGAAPMGGASATGGEAPADLKAISQSCDEDAQCESGHCPSQDGVCCESACDIPCMACRNDKTGAPNGTCAPVFAGSNPDGECVGDDLCQNAIGCCGDIVPSSGGTCPAICSRCEDDTCVIACEGMEICRDAMVECPPGFACRADCLGDKACEDFVLTCPDIHRCELRCESGDDVCRDAQLLCGTGLCTLTCSSPTSCNRADMECGPDACIAQCPADVQQTPDVECNEACSCTPC